MERFFAMLIFYSLLSSLEFKSHWIPIVFITMIIIIDVVLLFLFLLLLLFLLFFFITTFPLISIVLVQGFMLHKTCRTQSYSSCEMKIYTMV
jgi:hypothetical protein